MAKRAMALIFVLILTLNIWTGAAMVSENDGSAFITKAEFDSLKNTFQSQIDSYNSGIDNKIDSAIASYLAGVTISTTNDYSFPVASGEYVLIGNSDYIKDLTFSKATIDFDISVGGINAATTATSQGGGTLAGNIRMKRTGAAGYEAFVLKCDDKTTLTNNKKFDYYVNDGLLSLTNAVVFSHNLYRGNIKTDTATTFRWHAGAWKKATLQRNWNGSSDSASTPLYYDDRVTKTYFYEFYGTGVNYGIGYFINGTSNLVDGTCTVDAKLTSDNKIKYYIDDGKSESQIWVIDPTTLKDNIVASAQTNYKTTNQQYNTPQLAGITTTEFLINHWEEGSSIFGANYKNNVTATWVTYGEWNNTSTSKTGTSAPWYEFHFETVKRKSNEVRMNNISDSIISNYTDYHGYLTEGLPIGNFKQGNTVKFKFDTTSLGSDTYIAFSNKPFAKDTDISGLGANSAFTLTIDGTTNTKSCAKINASSHEFKIEMKGNNDLFFKIAYPRTGSPTTRKSFKMPDKYTLETSG